jgi:hypothetical protein
MMQNKRERNMEIIALLLLIFTAVVGTALILPAFAPPLICFWKLLSYLPSYRTAELTLGESYQETKREWYSETSSPWAGVIPAHTLTSEITQYRMVNSQYLHQNPDLKEKDLRLCLHDQYNPSHFTRSFLLHSWAENPLAFTLDCHIEEIAELPLLLIDFLFRFVPGSLLILIGITSTQFALTSSLTPGNFFIGAGGILVILFCVFLFLYFCMYLMRRLLYQQLQSKKAKLLRDPELQKLFNHLHET